MRGRFGALSGSFAAAAVEQGSALRGGLLSVWTESNQRATRSLLRGAPFRCSKSPRPRTPFLRGPPIRWAGQLTQRRGWLRRHTPPRLSLPLRRRKVRLSPFPPDGENCARSLAPPLPGEPALLGFAGRDGRLAKTPPGTAQGGHSVPTFAFPRTPLREMPSW